MTIISIEPIRAFETTLEAEPVVAPPRPAPRKSGLSKSAGASPSSSGGSPSPAARAPARRLSANDAVEELRGMEWLALCGLDEPSPSRSFEDDEDPFWREWLARSGL
jgi:hypothetical protein